MIKTAQNMFSYNIILDINQDAYNWYTACNNTLNSHGIDFSKSVPFELLEKVRGLSEENAKPIIINFLKNKYLLENDVIQKYINFAKTKFDKNFILACTKLEELTNRPLYRNKFSLFITTFQKAPYFYPLGYIWLPVGFLDPIKTFMHESLHFQFIHYWRNNEKSSVNGLSNSRFEYLKESLTVILDEEIFPITTSTDKGYEIHKLFRDELHRHWKKHHDFDKLVEFGLERLSEFIK